MKQLLLLPLMAICTMGQRLYIPRPWDRDPPTPRPRPRPPPARRTTPKPPPPTNPPSVNVVYKPLPRPDSPCADVERSQGSVPTKFNIPVPSWLLTPSVVEVSSGSGHYQAVGRIIHARHLKERLGKKSSTFKTSETSDGKVIKQLDILADTLYIEQDVVIYGIQDVKIYAREIVSPPGGKLKFSAPNRAQRYTTAASSGRPGQPGANGIDGPEVEIFCDSISGFLDVTSSGGDGEKGQDGGNGGQGKDNVDDGDDKGSSACTSQSYSSCNNVGGENGKQGHKGGDGGNAGTPGNGGDAGSVKIRFRELTGKVQLHACAGVGGQNAKNGEGGKGGKGSSGGLGVKCRKWKSGGYCITTGACAPYRSGCTKDGTGDRGSDGSVGDDGKTGQTPNARGREGTVQGSDVQSGTLDAADKQGFPLEIFRIMRRQAEDLLLGNPNDQTGKDGLRFIVSLAKERNDVEQIKRDAERKLGFLGMEGYDIFGKNAYFAPRLRYDELEKDVTDLKTSAAAYETSFNEVMKIENLNKNFKLMATKMSAVSKLQVNAERDRLVEAKRIAISEKNLTVKAIETLEEKMGSILRKIVNTLPASYDKAKFNRNDLFAVMQGMTGFTKAVAGKNPLDFVDAAIGVTAALAHKGCLKSLDAYLNDVKTWLTFGDKYKPLEDSSDLDFDQVNVSSVPDIMQVNLEMNKETFAAELVCLLDVASLPPDVAGLKAKIESFFVAGSARIDLIAKCIDLDNDIGGYNFDIPLLNETANAITKIGSSGQDDAISVAVQQTFAENLLSTYEELERAYVRKIYQYYKALEFRTLWTGNNPFTSFRRVASESAVEIKALNGVAQLTDVYNKAIKLRKQAVSCFTSVSYTLDSHRWSFDNVKNKEVFTELAANGKTNFSINIYQNCPKCFNMRLRKMYIELYGDEKQPNIVPAKVYVRIRHRNSSYFRAGDNTIRTYVQKLGHKTVKFDRFTITDKLKCREKKENGENTRHYCMNDDDYRWQPMCSNPGKDAMSGANECISPFGMYDLSIPINKQLACDSSQMESENCKDLDLSKFTKMNVWVHMYYWENYPTGPDDNVCRSGGKRNQTTVATQWE